MQCRVIHLPPCAYNDFHDSEFTADKKHVHENVVYLGILNDCTRARVLQRPWQKGCTHSQAFLLISTHKKFVFPNYVGILWPVKENADAAVQYRFWEHSLWHVTLLEGCLSVLRAGYAITPKNSPWLWGIHWRGLFTISFCQILSLFQWGSLVKEKVGVTIQVLSYGY